MVASKSYKSSSGSGSSLKSSSGRGSIGGSGGGSNGHNSNFLKHSLFDSDNNTDKTRRDEMPSSSPGADADANAASSSSLYRWHFFLFMLMGSGANWVIPTALAQEIPYFENHLPEGLCIATYMNACVNFGLVSLTVYVYVINNHFKIPYNYSVPTLLCLSCISSFLIAGTYRITIGNASALLYLCCALSGSVGALASVIMSPFLMAFENNFISASRSGGSGMILLTALVAAAQSPGSNETFSVTIYFVIFGVLLAFSVPSYYYIVRNKIALREKEEGEDSADVELSTHSSSVLADMDNPMLLVITETSSHSLTPHNHQHSTKAREAAGATDNKLTTSAGAVIKSSSSSSSVAGATSSSSQNSAELCQSLSQSRPFSGDFVDNLVYDIASAIIPKSLQSQYPWLVHALPYMFTVAWADFNTWGMMTAALPFAIAATSKGDGSENLAIAYEIGSLCLVSGDLSTTLIHIPYRYAMSLFTIATFVIYLAALNLPGYHTEEAAPILIVLYCLTQFLEAHMLTSSYRACATNFPLEQREDASRAVGIADQIGTTMGAVFSTVLVSQIGQC